MMKAFVRRNGSVIARAELEADAELAAAWERKHVADVDSSASPGASATPFDRAYAAYARHAQDRSSREASGAPADASVHSDTRSAAATANTTPDFLRTDRMAEAWALKNQRRVCAQRFADRFAGAEVWSSGQEAEEMIAGDDPGSPTTSCSSSSSGADAVAAAAVVALYVAPMLVGRAYQMCVCEMKDVFSDAVDWVSFNAEAFDAELARLEGRLAAGNTSVQDEQDADEYVPVKALGGCECGREGSTWSSCRHFVACPVVTRRVLKAADPVCCECEFVDGLVGGDLFDMFDEASP